MPPHLPPLDSSFERAPSRPLPENYAPFDGIQYKVTNTDTIANIASRGGRSAKFVMDYAFGTHDPREVNWYLRNRVGCKAYGPKKQNFAFSDAADPGLIWLPRQVYTRLTEKPKPTAHRYDTPGIYPRYRQKTSNVCWGAAVANIYDWKKRKPRRRVTEALTEIGLQWGFLYETGSYMTGPTFRSLAKDAGLRPHATGDFLQDDYWMSTIKSRGQMLMLQSAYGAWTHWIVITGYEVQADGKLTVIYVDPGDGIQYRSSADTMYSKLLDAATQVAKVWSF
ncbi:MAG: papain-like cysteine protease family protein [Planctomycetaceae bacterium]